MTSVGEWVTAGSDHTDTVEEKEQMKGEIYNLRMNLIRITSELDTEKSLRTMADQQLRHALSLLRDSVRNHTVCNS